MKRVTGGTIDVNRRGILFIALLVFLFILAFPVGILTGSADISFADFIAILTHTQSDSSLELILYSIRAPRMILAFSVGAALAISGAVFQALLINPLADSYTVGVSSGAALGASIAILLGIGGYFIPIFAIIGSVFTLVLVLLLSRKSGGLEPRNLILSGIIIGAILSAALSLVKTISGDSLGALIFWLLGSFSGRSWSEVYIVIPYFILGIVAILTQIRELDILSFGKESALSLGVNVTKSRYVLIISASMLSAVSVSVSGVIGFIGLVVPHIVRSVFGASNRLILPLSLITGGVILLWADIFVRAISFAGEVPVGVITALIGGPFFAMLLVRSGR